MPSYALGSRSRSKLVGVHPALSRVVEAAIQITGQDFSVIEGVDTKVRQRDLYKAGHTRTLNSRHLTGHAVDLAPYPLNWDDIDAFRSIGHAMLRAAQIEEVALTWGALKQHGGMWRTFKDMPHFQIPTNL